MGISSVYIELHAASAFSFLQGASLPETLVERAAALGYPALALVDADGVYGAPRFHRAAKQAGLRAIIGAELTITHTSQIPHPKLSNPKPHIPTWVLPVLVESQTGYQNLCRLVTRMKMRAAKGEGALALEELEGRVAGLVAIAGRPLLDARQYGVGGLLDRLVGIFGRAGVSVELQRHFLRHEEDVNAALTELAAAYRVPIVATNGVRFAEPVDRPLFDVLTCVRHHTTLDQAGQKLARNAERFLKSPDVMAQLFADRPAALEGTAALAERLEYTMADLGYRFPTYPVPDGESEMSFLRHITEAGARERYRPYHDKARAQIARELDLIEKLDLAGYFLIVWDVVNYCRQHDILVQGRGSAANSAVCYSLGITAVDPIAMELLFERFLSEERGEWPDIDLDLPSGDRRERVIQHVYEKYGRLGAAMTANVITYRTRSAAREVGKALSLDPGDIDTLAKVMNNFEFVDPNDTFGRNLAAAGLSLAAPRMRTFAELWLRIQDLPRHLGQHSGGMVICQGELDAVVPLEPASMPGRVVIQWDKDDCAEMGIVKVDLLGLGMMAVLQDAIELVNAEANRDPRSAIRDPRSAIRDPQSGSRIPDGGSRTVRFDLAHLPHNDADVYDLLQKADTVGVFQVESRAQMATLPRLKPVCFYDLVVQVAIIRPGPIVGQMVHPYLNRRAGKEPVVPLHECLEPILARTLGVPLFQEQLLRMAMAAAGFTGGQAEELRRAMGFKRSERRMKQIETQLREGMAQNGITGETAERIITSITSFALYGFPESHAASFALLAYASAYLKVHYPAAFYAALLNNQPMGFYHPATLVKDAQRRGVRFHPIDVQRSDWLCTIERDGAIRLGFMYVTGLRKEMGQAIAAFETGPAEAGPHRTQEAGAGFSRPDSSICAKCGCDDDMIEVVRDTGTRRTYFCNTCAHEWSIDVPTAARFRSIEDLVQRTGLRRDELTTLADIGALNAFTHERRSALWQVERAVRPAGELFEDEQSTADCGESPLPRMDEHERLRSDYAGMGLTIGPHPMALRRDDLALRGVLRASDLPQAKDGRRVRVAGMVITRQRPGTAKGFVFLTLEDETGISNIIVRPDLFDRERMTVIRQPFLLVEGVLQHQEGVLSIRAERVQGIDGGASVDAHDFY
jgi:error-prone DNA polymerase